MARNYKKTFLRKTLYVIKALEVFIIIYICFILFLYAKKYIEYNEGTHDQILIRCILLLSFQPV